MDTDEKTKDRTENEAELTERDLESIVGGGGNYPPYPYPHPHPTPTPTCTPLPNRTC